jgi:uncharacterized protein YeaC (DUF1315 family)
MGKIYQQLSIVLAKGALPNGSNLGTQQHAALVV